MLTEPITTEQPRQTHSSRRPAPRTRARRSKPATAPPAIAVAEAPALFAHDMRGALANLAILVEIIAAAAGQGETARIGRDADRAARIIDRLDGMIGDMLARFRTLGDPLAVRQQPVDLADLVATVVALNEPLAERRGVRLHCVVVEPTKVDGCPHLLMQAIDNLVGNAITLTPRGGRVVCEAGPGEAGGAIMSISDQGPGLTQAEIDRLFQPFARAHAASDGERRSTGLGLWIVRLIAERHGGRVSATSDGPGRGARFTMCLPA